MYTMFAKSLPLDVTSRVWDVFFRDGEEFLFRTALGWLRISTIFFFFQFGSTHNLLSVNEYEWIKMNNDVPI